MRSRRRNPLGAFHHRHHERADGSPSEDEPFAGYDRMDERELVGRLFRHSQVELEGIEAYERAHESRTRVLNKLHYLRQREPLEGYDSMGPDEVAKALEQADLATIRNVRAYERKFANRPPVVEAVEAARRRRMAEGPADATPDYHATSYGASVSGGSRAAHPDGLEANRALVARFYAEAINGRDLDAVDRLLSAEFVHDGEARGHAGQRQAVAAFLGAFPDLHTETELILAEGDLVAAHLRWTGTHRGTFAGVEPTGRRVEFTSTAVLRVQHGLIAEAWDEVDLAGLMSQLRGDG